MSDKYNVNKSEISLCISPFNKEVPYFNYTGSLVVLHGQFNNSLSANHQPTKYELENLPSLYDSNVFDLNVKLDANISP